MRIIKFLGSLSFALFLIAGLAVILSVSTVLESIHGTPFVQENFYQAHWFDFFLGLVWVNIFCATLTRWPFKKKHIGFIITHIGILTLLLGSLGTRVWGREGQMTLFEAEAKDRMLETGFSLRASLPGGGAKSFDLKAVPLKKPVVLPLDNAPFRLELTRVFPHAVEARSLEEAPDAQPNHALHATLSSEMLGFKQDILLIENDPADPDSAAKTIGPATFILENTSAGQVSAGPKLRLTRGDGTSFELPVTEETRDAEWKEAGLKISGLRYYPKARVEENHLVNLDSAPHPNPAVEFEVSDDSGRSEHHTRFSFFPEFESLRGGSRNNVFDLKVELTAPPEAAEDEGPSFRFLVSGDKWSYRVHSMKTGLSEVQPLPLKEPVRTGWMDMAVRVDKTFGRARIVTNVNEDRDGRSETPGVELRIRREGLPEETRRLLLGRSLLVGSGNSSLRLSVEPRSQELPFSLGLMDFRKIDYPGTSKPAAFESDVVLRDATSGVTLERTISMNKPLDYLGYRVFQSSFIQDEHLGEASVFTVAKNPGMPAIYGGAALIFLGVILLFYFHPFFTGKKMMLAVLLSGALLFSGAEAQAASWQDMRTLAVQHNGRVKPFDSLARQTLKFVSGKSTWQGLDPVQFMAGILEKPETIADIRWIRVDLPELKKTLGVDEKEHFFSLKEIQPSLNEVDALVAKAKQDRDRDLKPSKLEQKAEELSLKVRTVQSLIDGTNHTRLGPLAGASSSRLQLEVLYNRAKPFECAAALYFLAFLLSSLLKQSSAKKAAFFLVLSAFAFHTFGLAVRVYVLSRPPVSNMYESMIFMNWALVAYALVFWTIRRQDVLLAAGAAMSGAVMLYANLLPIDSSLDVVVAVLRSNYWLTIHVLTIVSSYGAFGLALGLGHRHLFLASTGKLSKKAASDSAELIFRVLQLGTLLIGTGTFLGGVWANESWGRFWGWDPKETWALITFLGYLLVVHLKYAKKINDFYLALSSVVGFLLVLMTWYGVNFVLGRGLHSYGAGSGGMQWVIYFLAFEAVFVGWALLKRFME